MKILLVLQGCLYQKSNKFEKSISSFEKSILATAVLIHIQKY